MDVVLDLSRPHERLPLVVDLDGTLIRSDLLLETFFATVGAAPLQALSALSALARGRAAFKDALASRQELDAELLPYDDAVLALIHAARADGREVFLASASNWRQVKAVAEHLGLFDGWMASDATLNLSGERKAERLVAAFGQGGFDYIGNDRADLAIWRVCAKATTIRASARTRGALEGAHANVAHLASERAGPKAWLKLLRVHQWVKNGLLAVPVVTAHAFVAGAIVSDGLGVVAFCLCASSVYLLNDLIDLQADRAHPTKHLRALARGAIPLAHAIIVMPLLLVASAAIALYVGPAFLAVLALYYCLTTAYSFVLKRKMLIDVVTLAALYSIRVFAGAVAINVDLSEWLLGFSMFIFMSLALIKRYAELAVRLDLGMPDPTNRNYKVGDLQIVSTMAGVCGFNAVTVLALYISSPDVHRLYHDPRLLWLLCPVMMYWIGRMLLMTHRRFVTEDPILFAVHDRVSLMTLGVCIAVVAAAYV